MASPIDEPEPMRLKHHYARRQLLTKGKHLFYRRFFLESGEGPFWQVEVPSGYFHNVVEQYAAPLEAEFQAANFDLSNPLSEDQAR